MTLSVVRVKTKVVFSYYTKIVLTKSHQILITKSIFIHVQIPEPKLEKTKKWKKFSGLQNGTLRLYKLEQVLGITNLGKRDYKTRQLQGFPIEAKRLQIRVGIPNGGEEISKRVKYYNSRQQRFQIGTELEIPGNKDFRLGQRLKIGVEITNWYRTIALSQNAIILQGFFHPRQAATGKIQLGSRFIVGKFLGTLLVSQFFFVFVFVSRLIVSFK